MNDEPATMVIWDADEERTLVDRAAFAGPPPAFEGSGDPTQSRSPRTPDEHPKPETQPRWQASSALLSRHGRQVLEFGLAVAVLFGLGSVARQQWQVAEALRATLAQLQAPPRASDPAPSLAWPQARETPDPGDIRRKEAVQRLAADERDELERHAAALIASNDFPAALRQYQTLAELFPGEGTFRDFVAVLRAKLGCDRVGPSASSSCP